MAATGTSSSTLRLLGPARWHNGSAEHLLTPERGWQLLARLALAGDWMRREPLALLFWPDHPADAARRNLRKVLHRLGAHAPLDQRDGALRCTAACDVSAFEAALAAGELAVAASHWRGTLAPGLEDGAPEGFVQWLGYERQRLAAAWREARLRAAVNGTATAALQWSSALLADDPLDEEAWSCRVQALHALGRAAEAQAAVAERDRLVHEALGLNAAPLRWQASGQGAALASGTPLAGPLSAATLAGDSGDGGTLVGRSAERRCLAQALAQAEPPRWITLSGPGGIGKSRLLQGLLAQGLFGADACWVPLEDLSHAGALPARLATRLGLALAGAEPPWQQLAQALAARPRWLLLDNLEHLPDALPPLQALLAAAPGLRLACTSRERCGVAGEWLLRLDGLPWPEPEDLPRAAQFDAVQLFNQRAKAVDPRFDADAERAAVVALCAQVEGLPLALELAAGWVRHLRVAALVAALRSGELIDAEDPQRPPRQRSLQGVLDQAWRRLSPVEQGALAALAVHRGGFTLASARAVAGASLPLLGALVDKSLLRAEGDGRFGLHPLVQQHALARLAADPAAQLQARRAHADHHLQTLARFPRGRWAEQPAWFEAADADVENLRQAWQQGVAEGWVGRVAAATIGLASHCHARTWWDDGLALLAQAEPLLARDAAALAQLQCSRALLQSNRSDDHAAAALARQALRLARRGRDPRLVRAALFILGHSLREMGQVAAAHRCYAESLRRARAEGDAMGQAMNLHTLAELALLRGRAAEAVALLTESLALQEQHGSVHADALSDLGLAQHQAGQPQAAQASFARAAALLQPPRAGTEHTVLGCARAWVALDAGRPDEAAAHCQAAEDGLALGGQPAHRITIALLRARLALLAGQAPRAAGLIAQAGADALRRRNLPAQLSVAVHVGEWLRAQQHLAAAADVLDAALARPELPHELRQRARRLRPAGARRATATQAPGTGTDDFAQALAASLSALAEPAVAPVATAAVPPGRAAQTAPALQAG